MDKDNAKDFLPLVQALAEGKTIQLNNGSESDPNWISIDYMSSAYPSTIYRIKPEPREWKASVVTKKAHKIGEGTAYEIGDLVAYDNGDEKKGFEIIRVREVIE